MLVASVALRLFRNTNQGLDCLQESGFLWRDRIYAAQEGLAPQQRSSGCPSGEVTGDWIGSDVVWSSHISAGSGTHICVCYNYKCGFLNISTLVLC